LLLDAAHGSLYSVRPAPPPRDRSRSAPVPCCGYTPLPVDAALRKPPRRRSPAEHELLGSEEWRLIDRELRLSAREHDIVELVLADVKESAMGARLGISPHTVHTHLERLYRKLGVTGRVQLVVRALGACLVHLRTLSHDHAAPARRDATRLSPEQVTAARD
jgi:DNA-binding CsgD family transcriptional regulator